MNFENNILEKISFHAVCNETLLDVLFFAKEKGFEDIQIAIEVPHLSFERLSDKECQKIREFCKNNGFYISIHAPDEITFLIYI